MQGLGQQQTLCVALVSMRGPFRGARYPCFETNTCTLNYHVDADFF